mmetsp:Transcript_5168/g.18568  ORF Transcript_5168/g.18568 Transcript_5168/m.18568 type:complete len:244 (-) Transcript_5168:436-1167(-)
MAGPTHRLVLRPRNVEPHARRYVAGHADVEEQLQHAHDHGLAYRDVREIAYVALRELDAIDAQEPQQPKQLDAGEVRRHPRVREARDHVDDKPPPHVPTGDLRRRAEDVAVVRGDCPEDDDDVDQENDVGNRVADEACVARRLLERQQVRHADRHPQQRHHEQHVPRLACCGIRLQHLVPVLPPPAESRIFVLDDGGVARMAEELAPEGRVLPHRHQRHRRASALPEADPRAVSLEEPPSAAR